MSPTERLGVLLHEMGHHLADCDQAERDDTDHARAVKTFWTGMRAQSNEEQHNTRWLRATLHLWHRACRAGYEVPLSSLGEEHHAISKKRIQPLLDETTEHEGEPIESILGSRVKPAKRKRSQRGPRDQADVIAGQVVTVHADGTVTEAMALDGSSGGGRHASVRAFLSSLQQRERGRHAAT